MAAVRQDRYYTLDAMRGVAALMVGVHHFWLPLATSGYLAVDFFFALSGFVLARAYEGRLARGGPGRFMLARFLRLYPLYLAGSVFGLIHALQSTLRAADFHLSPGGLVSAVAFGIAMLPCPTQTELYPLNIVFWSIFAELMANLMFACFLVRYANRTLVLIVALSAIAFVVMLLSGRVDLASYRWSGLPLLMVRTVFSFTIGVVIARFAQSSERSRTMWMIVPIVALCMILSIDPGDLVDIYYLVSAIILMPLLLFIRTIYELPSRFTPVAAILGDVSYAFYACHMPLAHAAQFLARREHMSPIVVLPVFIGSGILVSAALVHFWDKPVRARLSRVMSLRRSAAPTLL